MTDINKIVSVGLLRRFLLYGYGLAGGKILLTFGGKEGIINT
mgnify:FL=1